MTAEWEDANEDADPVFYYNIYYINNSMHTSLPVLKLPAKPAKEFTNLKLIKLIYGLASIKIFSWLLSVKNSISISILVLFSSFLTLSFF